MDKFIESTIKCGFPSSDFAFNTPGERTLFTKALYCAGYLGFLCQLPSAEFEGRAVPADNPVCKRIAISLFEFSLQRIDTLLVTVMQKLDMLIIAKALQRTDVALFALCTVWRVLKHFRNLSLEHIPTELAAIARDVGESTSYFLDKIQETGNRFIRKIATSQEDFSTLATRIIPDFSMSSIHISYQLNPLNINDFGFVELSEIKPALESSSVLPLDPQPLFASLGGRTSISKVDRQQEWTLLSNQSIGDKIDYWMYQANATSGSLRSESDTDEVLHETIDRVKFVARWNAQNKFSITRMETIVGRRCAPDISPEFWDARVAASGLDQTDTRIPLVPDQSRFLEKWFDWHRGYRTIKHEDGREERQALLGENLADVAPGYLPRTLDELRAGVTHESSTDHVVREGSVNQLVQSLMATEDLDIDPEDRIFDLVPTPNITDQATSSSTTLLLASTSSTIYSPPSPPSSAEQFPSTLPRLPTEDDEQPLPIQVQVRRVAALRREVQRLRAGIERVMSGLQDLGEAVPDSQDTLQHTTSLTTRLGNIEAYLRSPDYTALEIMDFRPTVEPPSTDGSSTRHTSISPAQHMQQTPQIPLPYPNDRVYTQAQTSRPINRQGPGRPFSNSRGHSRASLGIQPVNTPPLDPQLALARSRVDAARATEQLYRHQLASATESRDEATARLAAARTRLQECQRALNRLERLERSSTSLFGSREEIEREGNDYVSPVAGLFRTYHGRYQAAEEQRRQERMLPEILAAEDRSVESTEDTFRLLEDDTIRTVDEVRQELAEGVTRPRSTERPGVWNRLLSHPPQYRTRRIQRHIPRPSWTSNSLVGSNQITNDTDDESILETHETSLSTTSPAETDYLARLEASMLTMTESSPVQRRAQARTTEDGRGSGRQTEFQDFYHRMVANDRPPSIQPSIPSLDGVSRPPQLVPSRFRNLNQMARDGAPGLYHGQDVAMADLERLIVSNAVVRARRERTPDPEPKSLDKDDGRPDPITDEDDFLVKMECKICYSQVATVAVLPCGHCVMCKWCANEAIPSHKADQTVPQHRSACPVCRKRVKNKATIYGGESKDPKSKLDDAQEGTD
ncbi:hypothetical protein MMC27_002882 [Xylographa pallens]|nr:hypothetical protein [Xylographa pallens]